MKQSRLFLFLFSLVLLLTGCRKEQPPVDINYLRSLDSTYKAVKDIRRLSELRDSLSAAGDTRRLVYVYRYLGKKYRDSSDFMSALQNHRAALGCATQLNDTIEMVRAYNNIGTDFRRLGIIEEAAHNHYVALQLCDQSSGQDLYEVRKNHVTSLNGLGNLYLSMGDLGLADSLFHEALKTERLLGSDLGQAINCANIGSVCEQTGQADSAWVYYQMSMDFNRRAGSVLGVSLCHISFGGLYELDRQWDKAIGEYKEAYAMMESNSDNWHWLQAALALAKVNISKGDYTAAAAYLDKAWPVAVEIRSLEHQQQLSAQYFRLYEKLGNTRKALDYHILTTRLSDSINNKEDMMLTQNYRLSYISNRYNEELSMIEENYQAQHRVMMLSIVVVAAALLIALLLLLLLWLILRTRSRRQRLMQNVEAMRRSFYTNVTHEFRTPLTVIIGQADFLTKSEEDPERQQALEAINTQGNILLDLVNQLLDISKISSEIGTAEWRTGDIVAITGMTVESLRLHATRNLISVEFVAQEPSMMMDFVPDYIRKMLSNLICNAIKFTPRGGRVYVSLSRVADKVRLEVVDNGVGIAQEDLPHIFDTFYQSSTNNTASGTGIGLSLVKQMAEAMGGTVTATSIRDRGTCFEVLLPVHHEQGNYPQWIPEMFTGGQMAYRKETAPEQTDDLPDDQLVVLVVEDNAEVSHYIGNILKDRYKMITAGNGREGLLKAVEYVPDVVLTDVMMPEMDGYELCRQLRQNEVTNHIPVIMITARSEMRDQLEGLRAGADAYLIKPFNSDELVLRIEKLIEQRQLLHEKYSQTAPADAPTDASAEEPSSTEAGRQFLMRLNQLINTHVADEGLNSMMLADYLCLSQRQLNRKVKSVTGMDTSAYIRDVRMHLAQHLLASTDKPVSEIYVLCGFDSPSYFSKIFRTHSGMSPTDYRKSHRPQK